MTIAIFLTILTFGVADYILAFPNWLPLIEVMILATLIYYSTEIKQESQTTAIIGFAVTGIIGFSITSAPEIIATHIVALVVTLLLFKHMRLLLDTRRMIQEHELYQSTLIDNVSDAIITTGKNGEIEYMNPVAEALTGYSLDQAKRTSLARIFDIAHEKTLTPLPNPIDSVIRTGKRTNTADAILRRQKKPHEIIIEHTSVPINDTCGQIQAAAIIFKDLTKARTMTKQLSHYTSHDPLTGLVNRTEFERRLERTLLSIDEHESQHVLCYLDLQEFKMISHACGHEASDELLRQVSTLFKTKMRRRDTLARLGADEFGVLLEHCTLDTGKRVANELIQRVQNFRFTWEGKIFSVGLSAGIIRLDDSGLSLSKALSLAHHGCTLAQQSGRNMIRVMDAGQAELPDIEAETMWLNRINEAIENHHIDILAQPIEPLSTNFSSQRFVELFITMLDEDKNCVPAGAFLPIAQRYGLQEKLDRIVTKELITFLTKRPDIVITTDLFCINLSLQSVSDSTFIGFLKDQLNTSPINAEKLCFEISESIAFSNIGKTCEFVQQLRTLGCKTTLDQFGSGIASFAQLKNIPVDFLKIDGSFIRKINSDQVNSTMVESINQIGHMLGLETIAGYCENEETLRQIKRLGIDYVQGFGIDRPVKLQDLTLPSAA